MTRTIEKLREKTDENDQKKRVVKFNQKIIQEYESERSKFITLALEQKENKIKKASDQFEMNRQLNHQEAFADAFLRDSLPEEEIIVKAETIVHESNN